MIGKRAAVILAAIIAFTFMMAATCGHAWIETSDEELGLWKECNQTKCFYLQINVEDWFNVARGAAIVACIFAILGLVMAIVMVIRVQFPPAATGFLLLIAGLAATVSFSVFAGGVNDNGKEYGRFGYGWSYVIGWLGVPAAVIGALIAFAAACDPVAKDASEA